MTQSSYHLPVLLSECLTHLITDPNGVYVDVTFGGGGHSKAILEKLGEKGTLLAFDQDQDAAQQAAQIQDPRFIFVKANFRYLKRYLRLHKIEKVTGILADLGISSHQIDTAERGFSTRFEGRLDMRMDNDLEKDAIEVLNKYSETELHQILGKYGEVKNAKTLAAALVSARINKPLVESEDLKKVLQKYAPKGKEFKYFAQVYQAIRIEVNEEMQVLEEFLNQVPQVLAPKGRLVVMAYHSLEDRMVKNFIQQGKTFGQADKDFYGNIALPLKNLIKKPIVANEEEVAQNPRARSAKLRVAELS
ncbi:16S rRNA (cytosine(1402)-N(4))-methyltransferase RsmH [Hugenholtzia roseola]|uniref:16S rRNA (cytosine(1402)-N(4))-methyltransferase RsmH n=1 Tax=Hugenholtzia roseola TaxID=1002 RepID=UPI00041278CD|nr:16S rRNA (cytosine(1402)-N(4))-methyltransferase RsmH [Hugenholtzia roseola]